MASLVYSGGDLSLSAGSDSVKGLGLKLNDDEVRLAGVQETKTSTRDTQRVVAWRGTTINAGQLLLDAEHDIAVLGSQLNTSGDATLQAGHALTVGGRDGEITQEHKETTETITVAAAVRNGAFQCGCRVSRHAVCCSHVRDPILRGK